MVDECSYCELIKLFSVRLLWQAGNTSNVEKDAMNMGYLAVSRIKSEVDIG